MHSPWMAPAVKVIALLLLLLNVSMHSVVALFVGGPFGLVAYLVFVATLWTGGWLLLRSSHHANA